MALATPTRTFPEVDFFCQVEYQCAWFDVVNSDPYKGINLFVTKLPRPWQERNFEDRLVGELEVAGQHSCPVFSPAPLKLTHLRKGRLLLLGTVRGEDFGPFYYLMYFKNRG